jgi:hypothetical protein
VPVVQRRSVPTLDPVIDKGGVALVAEKLSIEVGFANFIVLAEKQLSSCLFWGSIGWKKCNGIRSERAIYVERFTLEANFSTITSEVQLKSANIFPLQNFDPTSIQKMHRTLKKVNNFITIIYCFEDNARKKWPIFVWDIRRF